MESELGINKAKDLLKPEILQREYSILVVDPYALNIIDQGRRKGKARLSFYSAFVAHTAREIIEDGRLGSDGKVVLFGDASFGPDYPSTGDLIKDYLIRDRTDGPIISENRVMLWNGLDMNQTATQVKKLAKYLKEQGIISQEVGYLGFDYHRERVENHANGFGVNVRYLVAEYIHSIYEPNFDSEILYELLPLEEIEKMETSRKKISRIDKKGFIPRLAKPILGGSYMIDNHRQSDGTLAFEYKPGKQKLKELGLT